MLLSNSSQEQAAKEAAPSTQQDCIDAEQSQSTTYKEDAPIATARLVLSV